ncbi:PAS domain S-box protein [Methanobacterium sp. MBAC-LM]|uniref:PAS domain S-box protein n=1 Tax=Methanobacterium sp. MBAC-LM TaxID=3412034 RepID=UPI003C79157D
MINNNHSELEKKVQSVGSILDLVNEGYWEWDIRTNKVIFNHIWYTLLNYEPYELPQSFETFKTLLHLDDKEKTLKLLNNYINQNVDNYEVDFRMIKKSGEICWILSRGNIERDDEGKPFRMVGTYIDITDYKVSEERVKYLNSILITIRNINRLIVTEKDKNILLTKSCNILSETRDFNLVWIGEIEKNNYKVISKAFSGSYTAFLDLINVTWDDSPNGQGPTGKAIKTIKTCIVNNISNDPHFKPWMDAIKKYGFNSAIALPLTDDDKIFGNLTIYSTRLNAFDNKEVSLLEEVAADISFAIHALKLEEERKKAEEQKQELIEELQQFTEELQVSNEELQVTTEELQVSNEELRQQGDELIELNNILHSSEERFKALIYNSTDIIRILDKDGLIIFDSPSSSRILGYPEGFFIGNNPVEFIHPDDREKVKNDLKDVYKEKNSGIPTEFRILKADGTYLPVESIAQNLIDVPGINGIVVNTHSIKERKKAEKKIRESRAKLKIAMDMAKLVYWEYDVESDLFTFDDQFYALYGTNVEKEGVTQMSSEEYTKKFIPPEESSLVAAEIAKSLETDDPNYSCQVDHSIIKADGEKRFITVRIAVIKDNNGHTIKIYGANQDITERKKSENEIRRLADVVKSSDDSIITKSLDGIITSWNKGAENTYGYPAEEILGKSISILEPPQLSGETEKLIEKIKQGEKINHYETLRLKKDGTLIDISITLSPVYDTSKKLVSISAITRDITERKLTEEQKQKLLEELEVSNEELQDTTEELLVSNEKLQAANKKFELANNYNRSLIEASLDPFVTFGPDGKITDVNLATELVTGYSRNELIATDISNYFTEPEKARKGYQHAFYEGFVRDYPLEIQHKNGTITPVLYNASVYKDESGKVMGLFAAARDITEIKKAEEALQESEKKYRDLAELLPQPVFESDLDGNITFTNRIGLETFGFTQEDLNNGLNMFHVLAPEDHSRAMEDTQRMLNGEGVTVGEYIGLRKDGTTFPMIAYVNSIIQKNKITGSRGVLMNISELKKAENEIKASLKEKEALLKEIYHRVKNNLQIISSLLDLQANYVDELETLNVLQESQNRVKSMAMIHEMLYQSNDLASIEFLGYVQNLVRDLFYSYGVKGNIKPVINIDHIILNIETAIPCGLIISELVSNSLKYAFPDNRNGEVSISVNSHGEEFELIIRDNGIGLPKNLDFKDIKISLGLRLVNILVDQLDGSIELNRSRGTEFKIKFKELKYKKRI